MVFENAGKFCWCLKGAGKVGWCLKFLKMSCSVLKMLGVLSGV